jgi:Spy/CpxP family protein refolding chaperone
MKKIFIAVLLAIMILNINIYSQPMEKKHIIKFMEKLNLTDGQKKDIENIHFTGEKQSIALNAKVETLHLELRQLLKADSPDKSAIEKKMREIADQKIQMHMTKLDSWFAINKLLNPDQQKEWKKVLERSPEMMKKMIKRHHLDRQQEGPPFEHPVPHHQ